MVVSEKEFILDIAFFVSSEGFEFLLMCLNDVVYG